MLINSDEGIDGGGAPFVIGFRSQGGRDRLVSVVAVIIVIVLEQPGVILVGEPGIKQLGILGPNRDRHVFLDRVQVDVIAKDVALDGLNEGLAAAFQTLEEVRAAKAHESLPGPRQVLNDSGFGLRRRFVR